MKKGFSQMEHRSGGSFRENSFWCRVTFKWDRKADLQATLKKQTNLFKITPLGLMCKYGATIENVLPIIDDCPSLTFKGSIHVIKELGPNAVQWLGNKIPKRTKNHKNYGFPWSARAKVWPVSANLCASQPSHSSEPIASGRRVDTQISVRS